MSTTKHNHQITPGPWKVRGFDIKAGDRVLATIPERSRALLGATGYDEARQQDLANADLIAAAPRMLETLLRIQRRVDSHEGVDGTDLSRISQLIKETLEAAGQGS